MKRLFLPICLILFVMIVSNSCNNSRVRLVCGGYTDSVKTGLSILDLSFKENSFSKVSEYDAGPNPSYFAISNNHGIIYAVNEVMTFSGTDGGGITTLRYNKQKGEVEKLGEMAVPNGGPCFISLTPSEDYLFLANYVGGSVVVVKLNQKGIPEKVTDNVIYEKEGDKVSHAHMIASNAAGNRIYVTDLGLDRIMIYSLDKATGKLSLIENGIVKLSEGAGPRHFVFNPSGTRMYVICELNSTISVFNVEPNGGLKPVQTLSTLDERFKGESFCADIHFGKGGKFLYGSNRGENTIVTFSINSDGTLSLAGRTDCRGNWPRNFVIDPSGKYLLVANQRSGNISMLRIDEKSGIPAATGINYSIKAPACLKFIN